MLRDSYQFSNHLSKKKKLPASCLCCIDYFTTKLGQRKKLSHNNKYGGKRLLKKDQIYKLNRTQNIDRRVARSAETHALTPVAGLKYSKLKVACTYKTQ